MQATKDMTKGSPIRLLFGFSMPLMLGNIFQQLYTVVDTMGVGKHLGGSALAVGLAELAVHVAGVRDDAGLFHLVCPVLRGEE